MGTVLLLVGRARAQSQPAVPPPSIVNRVEDSLLETGLFRALGVLFDTDRATLRPEARASLNAVGVVLARYPALRVEVGGHTDATGPAAYNQRLSEARADAVRAYLIDTFHLAPDRLVASGYGESQPLTDDGTATARALNRRVAFRALNRTALGEPARQSGIAQNEREPGMTKRTTPDTTGALPDNNRAALRRSIRAAAREALRRRLDTMAVLREDTVAEDVRFPEAGGEPSSALRDRWDLLGQPLRAVLPYTGVRLGAGPDQVVLGVRALFRSDESWLRLLPEAAFGYRDGFSLHAAASAVVPVAPRWTDPYRPYVGLGAALFTKRWLSGLNLGLQLLAGVQRELGSRGLVFGEYGSVDYSRQHRLIVGYRLAF